MLKHSKLQFKKLNPRGAVILEYALLLLACVAMALMISELVSVGSASDSQGVLIKFWINILNIIAQD